MARPSRQEEVDEVCRLAGCKPASMRNFFSRPGRLSPELRQRIAAAVATVGYSPQHAQGQMEGARLGYQLPRTWSSAVPNTIMGNQFQDLLLACMRMGAALMPLIVDPVVSGVTDVSYGTDDEAADDTLGLQGFHRRYAESLAPAEYQRVMRKFQVQGFFVNDLLVDDRRLEALLNWGIPYVAMGQAMRTVHGKVVNDERHPSVETDNARAIATMVGLLRDVGAQTFGHLGFADDGSVAPHSRIEAVRAAIGPTTERYLHHRVHYEKVDSEREEEIGRVVKWLKDNPGMDAVVADSDGLADLLRAAAPFAERRLARNLDAPTVADGYRPLMACGNDNDPVRQSGGGEATWWMTMHSDRPNVVQATVELMASRLHMGATAPSSVLVPPIIVGAPTHGPTGETRLDP